MTSGEKEDHFLLLLRKKGGVSENWDWGGS
jgi:hypothetical protein